MTTTARPDCHACRGTGTDVAFGGKCAECAPTSEGARRALDRRTVATTTNDRFHRPGERLDGRTFGGRQTGPTFATEAQVRFLETLVRERAAVADQLDETARSFCRTGWETLRAIRNGTAIDRRAMSQIIDEVKQVRVPSTGADRQRWTEGDVERKGAPVAARTNRYDGRCVDCGGHVPAETGALTNDGGRWVVRHVGECPAVAEPTPVAGLDLEPLRRFTSRGLVRVAVPGGDTRLKLRVKFANNGTVYVDDAAEYGEGRHYGRQAPGRGYEGDVTEALTAIVADPAAAIVAYTELVGRCGICNRHLEDETSVARGIGPVCAAKLGI